ncbi:MAG: gliding motility-associated C-terminal domain-containing protein [Chitinophagales bacterium]|nr:gliding motility-associated C-terminal domain-containing protein [Chitinophagales bacterium]
MYKFSTTILLSVLVGSLSAQNLVPNSSFEIVTSEPFYGCEFDRLSDWINPSGLYCGNNNAGTPDVFSKFSTGQAVLPNSFMGHTQPHTGDRCSGIVTYHQQLANYREYMMVPLTCPLIPGQTYNVSFWTTGGNPAQYIYHSNNIEICFTTSALSQTMANIISGVVPQITITTLIANSSWTLYSFQFTPTQPYTYMTIGNFKTDASTQIQSFGTNRPYAYYFIDDFTVEPAATNILGNDTSYCGSFSHVLSTGYSNTVWSTGDTAAQITVTVPGTYWASVTDNCITISDTIVISPFTSNFTINLGPDTTYCGNFSRTLSAGNATTLWSTGVTAAQITVTAPGVYWAYDSNSCYVASDTILISQNLLPQFSLPADTALCAGGVLPLSVSGATNVLWSTGATSSFITVSTPGLYWAEAYNTPGCAFRDTVVITQGNILNFTLGNDTTLCGGAMVLQPGINNAQYVWHDNSTNTSYTVTHSGTYSVTVSNQCGSVSGSVNITYLTTGCQLAIPTAFSPNGDGKNDLFRAVSFCPVPKFTMRVYNRWGELVFETDDITEGWNGVFRNTAQPVGVFVYYIEYYNNCSQQKETVAGNVTLLR